MNCQLLSKTFIVLVITCSMLQTGCITAKKMDKTEDAPEDIVPFIRNLFYAGRSFAFSIGALPAGAARAKVEAGGAVLAEQDVVFFDGETARWDVRLP